MALPSQPPTSDTRWRFSPRERIWIGFGLVVIVAFGALMERRTALQRTPKSDLGVFACAAQAMVEGKDLYRVTDWHGWHYQYPPTLAVLFRPLAHPLPEPIPRLAPGEARTKANTPWGYEVPGTSGFYGLHRENARFFVIVAIWYTLSVGMALFSAHALACVLEERGLLLAPPAEPLRRRRWWAVRLIPLLACLGSIGTDLSRGQVDLLMLAAIASALYLASRGARFISGLLLAFPVCIKLIPLLLLYPVWRKDGRMMLGVAAGLTLALGAIPIAAVGPTRAVALYRTWIDVLAAPALGKGADSSRSTELTNMNASDNQSLLAFLHNWRYHRLGRHDRPPQAAPWARSFTYLASAAWLTAMLVVFGRPRESGLDLLVCSGLLIGLGFLVSPIVHNYYFLLLMPLATAILGGQSPREAGGPRSGWRWTPPALTLFMLCDLAARLPVAGPTLRDWGLPLLSMVFLMLKSQSDKIKIAAARGPDFGLTEVMARPEKGSIES